jgi:HJR/Mrr/RecB family endonuclease
MDADNGWHYKTSISIRCCDVCGWWQASEEYVNYPIAGIKYCTQECAAAGSLLNLDITDLRTPVNEIRSYLLAKYNSRTSVHPRLMEQTVGAVFSDLGYRTEVTAYSRDAGIDVVLEDGSKRIGVQVKRTKNTIEVEQIREFIGALLLNGITSGCFVTTTNFSKGSREAGAAAGKVGHPIELVDAPIFLEMLKITRRPGPYRNLEEFLSMVGYSGMAEFTNSFGKVLGLMVSSYRGPRISFRPRRRSGRGGVWPTPCLLGSRQRSPYGEGHSLP